MFTGVPHCATVAAEKSRAHITTFEPHRPVYYDTLGRIKMIHDEWTLIMYYNLTNYWTGVDKIKTYLQQVNSLCTVIDPRYCNITVSQLRHEMETIDHYNELLLTPHKHLGNRKRRGLINGIGALANDLFGILDSRFAEKYENDIQSIQNNENYLLDLIRNQTTIVELENKALKKNEDSIKQQLTLMDDFVKQTDANIEKIESHLEIVMATSYFNSASLGAYLLINNLRKVQEMLFNSLTNVYKGHIDIQLISPINLINQLNLIAGQLPNSISLPIDSVRDDIKDIYKLLYVKARVTTNFFLFEVHIPLIKDEDFILYQVIPIPVKTEQGTAVMQLTSNYIAVDMKESTYITLSREDMQQCTQLKADKFICNKNLPILKLHTDNAPCEARLLGHYSTSLCSLKNATCKDAWIELHAPNSWLVTCCNICNLRTICDDDITSLVMASSGIVTLDQGCVLQSRDMTIYAHNIYNSNMKLDMDFEVPNINTSINKIVNLTYHKLQHNITLVRSDLDVKEIAKCTGRAIAAEP
ncbi:baculovirus F protein domain-containing protein [Phthorimaea operculella]|nr:baculovirus F protein domain-containing protein [Phthorimaea operculella]